MGTPEVFNIRLVSDHPAIKAHFDVHIDGVTIRDFMLFEGPNGPWFTPQGIPQIDADGRHRIVGGKKQYTRNISFDEGFRKAVLAQIEETEAPDLFASFATGEELLADTEGAIAAGTLPGGPAEAIRAGVVLALLISHVDRHTLPASLEPTPPELALARAIMVVFDRGPLLGTPGDYE